MRAGLSPGFAGRKGDWNMSTDETPMRVYLREDSSLRDDPGPPLNERHETIAIDTSSESFLFQGQGDTARNALNNIRLAHAKGSSGPKLKRCNAAIKRDKGGLARIVFKRRG